MALPLIPIIMAVASVASGLVQGISNAKNAKSEAKAVQESTQQQINERAKAAKKLMQQQKTSFLKSGVYFDSGTPVNIINETYDTSVEDINAMIKDSDTKVNNLMRQGKTAFFGSILEGVANGAMSYFMGGGMGAAASGANSSAKNAISSAASSAKNNFTSWYQNMTGKYKGGFGTASGQASTTKIA